MNLRRAFAFLAVSVLLAGCSAAEKPESTPTAEVPNMDEIDEWLNPTEKGAIDHKQEDPISLTCFSHSPCEATLQLTNVTFGGECEWGVVDYVDDNDAPAGTVLLQLKGVFDVVRAESGFVMLDDPAVIDKDGFTHSSHSLSMCVDKHDGYEPWNTTVDPGQKIKAYGSWFVDENAEYLLLNKKKIKLPDKKPNTPTTTHPPASIDPESSQAATPPASEGEAPPQPNTSECVGPAYICGYGTDENGNPNPSSGELQTLDGCEQGYITDPSLCQAVQDKANKYGW